MKKRKGLKRFLSVAVILALMVSMIPASAFAGTVQKDPYGVDKEWYNYRNNPENNGITNVKTPIDIKTASLKFGVKYGTGWEAAPMPPIILDGALYTGVGNKILKLDKETGAKLAESEEMFGAGGGVGYAMNPLLYAEGLLFCQVGNGVIQAIDYKTLKCVWHSKPLGGQTLSPISYVKAKDGKGYIYTGTWTNESKDGSFFCVSTGRDDYKIKDCVKGGYEKDVVWQFQPSGENKTSIKNLKYDPALNAALAGGDNSARRGFYWAGAYANKNYIAIGSDDGTAEGAYTPNAVFYTLDPLTGDIIDRVDKIGGDIRTTTVYDNGYLYFSTKGGHLHKISVDESGNLGEDSFIDLGGMTTASPVVYKNKIYIGVCGQGSQFNPDAGHGFAVVDNSKPKLGADSELYRIPIKGYPQAAALVSTAYVNEDFDQDGKADGRVYIYFTYNARPGGIYYTYDTPEQKDIAKESRELFIPPEHMQQYSLSTLCADREGTLYYKNDSCYLMAIETNPAILDTALFKDNNNEEVGFDTYFNPAKTEYKTKVTPGVKHITVELNAPENAEITVNGMPYKKGMKVDVPKEGIEIKVEVKLGEFRKIYNFDIRKQSLDTTLKELKLSSSNTYGSGLYKFSPEFDPTVTEYTVDMTEIEKPRFYRLWFEASAQDTPMGILKGENIERTTGPNGSADKKYIGVYLTDPTKNAKIILRIYSEADPAMSTDYIINIKNEKSVAPSDALFGDKTGIRLFGMDRYKTAIEVADAMKKSLGTDKFDTMIITSGLEYADALSGTYLASVKKAPILTVGNDSDSQKLVKEYAAANLKKGGRVYILGGTRAINSSYEQELKALGADVKRLGGANRYDTNFNVLQEAGIGTDDILLCSGLDFADGLSASATGKPVMLVDTRLTTEQKNFLKGIEKRNYYLVGGKLAVTDTVEKEIAVYGNYKRLTGNNRFETSIAVAEEFFGRGADAAVVAYAFDFPDGLSGGPLANLLGSPLLLVTSEDTACASEFVKKTGIKRSVVLGGNRFVTDAAMDKIMKH